MKSFSSIVRFLLVPLLSFWMTGAGCMLGCEGMVVDATHSSSDRSSNLHAGHNLAIVSGDACSAMGSSIASPRDASQSHSCCKNRKSESRRDTDRSSVGEANRLQSQAPSSGVTGDCPLASRKTAIVMERSGRNGGATLAAAQPFIAAQRLLEWRNPLSTQPQLPNRGHTYLRCCALLI